MGQGGLACHSSWGRKESDTTERLNWTELIWQYLWYLGTSDMAISRISFKLKTLLYSVPLEPISSYLNLLWLQWSGCLQLSCSVLFFFLSFFFLSSQITIRGTGDPTQNTDQAPLCCWHECSGLAQFSISSLNSDFTTLYLVITSYCKCEC